MGTSPAVVRLCLLPNQFRRLWCDAPGCPCHVAIQEFQKPPVRNEGSRPYLDSPAAPCLTSGWGVLQLGFEQPVMRVPPWQVLLLAGLGLRGLFKPAPACPSGGETAAKNPEKAGLDVPLPLAVKHALRCDYLRCRSGRSAAARTWTMCRPSKPARSLIWVRQENPSASMVRSGAALAFARIP